MIKTHNINIYNIHLQLLHISLNDHTLRRILSSLDNAIANCDRNIEESILTDNQDYIDDIVDFEVEVVENLLGTAFVVCQTYITAVVSKIIALHKTYHRSFTDKKLITSGDTKSSILSFGSNIVKNSNYTELQLIDAFANYFKRRDEWKNNWKKLKGKSANTANMIMAVGANSGNSGNLRHASELLGNSSYDKTIIFYKIVNEWCLNLYNDYYSELKNLELI
ncbi:MAG: hypothetical protein ACFFDN_49285 [Candidatus Hodarchaeota archaeon]